MAGIGPISQDWEPVVIRKKAPNAAAKRDEKAVNAARRAGADIETVKKGFFFTPFSFLTSIKIGKKNYICVIFVFLSMYLYVC